MDHDDLLTISTQLGTVLQQKGWTLALAESCTGGMAAQHITATPGSSGWFDCGFVTYSNTSKIELLGVSPNTLAHDGAVSEQTAKEMVLGALKHSHANVAAAITGIAGPDGGTPEKPVGTVCFAWADTTGKVIADTQHFTGDRETIRQLSVNHALRHWL